MQLDLKKIKIISITMNATVTQQHMEARIKRRGEEDKNQESVYLVGILWRLQALFYILLKEEFCLNQVELSNIQTQ